MNGLEHVFVAEACDALFVLCRLSIYTCVITALSLPLSRRSVLVVYHAWNILVVGLVRASATCWQAQTHGSTSAKIERRIGPVLGR